MREEISLHGNLVNEHREINFGELCWQFLTNFVLFQFTDLFHYIPPYSKKGGYSETLLNTCIAHSNSADLILSNNAFDWLSGDFNNKNQ